MAVVNAYRTDPYSYREARQLAEALGLSEPVAVTLVRRGYRTPEAAREFLEAGESHPPSAFRSMAGVVERILTAIREKRRITVHGDFDVDGVCATSILVGALGELGADCDWLIPDRVADGYGLRPESVERLAKRGTGLVLTADCGITSVEEVELARSLGMEAIVTDHHQPGVALPECPILHPAVDGYPFEGLCGAGVAWKLACALREASGSLTAPEDDLDLVALATVADIVPLVGENRALVRRGLEEVRRARRPGMRALLKAAGCERAELDEGHLAFRLGPRINAAGRLYRADAGVELFLTADEARAEEIATELNRANGERRSFEREVETGAEAALRALSEELRDAPGLVLAGSGWHPGVIGIVASRLVDRHYKPVVVVSLDGEGGGRGSGRSVPGFDLLAGLEACSEHLTRFGGHRAAAGLELEAERLGDFREAFAAHAAAVLGPDDLVRTERIDAMVGGAGIDLELAEELERLAPFGMGNPGVRLLVPSARLSDVQPMGGGKHSRFSLCSGSHRALGVAFGRSSLGVDEEDPIDAAVRLEVNRWNGSVEPRIVLRDLYPLEAAAAGASPHSCGCSDDEWWRRFERERGADLAVGDVEESAGRAPAGGGGALGEREVVHSSASAAAVLAELVSSGAGVLAICADASRRAALASGPSGLARFNGGAARIACSRCMGEAVAALEARSDGGLALTDYEALGGAPRLPAAFEHVVLVDPPPSAPLERLAARAPAASHAPAGAGGTPGHRGYLHAVWTEAEIPFAVSVLGEQLAQRQPLVAMFRELREAGEASGKALLDVLRGSGPRPRSPESAARCFRVLEELGSVRGEPDGGSGSVGVVSSERTSVERSSAFQAYNARYQEARQFLDRRKQP